MSVLEFVRKERKAQATYFATHVPPQAIRLKHPYRLNRGHGKLNLAPQIRQAAIEYFGPPNNIAWHLHASHGLSSQVCCLNFLMPLATQPELLGKIIGAALGSDPVVMLEMDKPPGAEPWYIAFEWIGPESYLSEWPANGTPMRGANVTSADAAIRFKRAGRTEIALIEWKYTERYGEPIDKKGNDLRKARYEDKAFDPDGPIRRVESLTVENFFYEPLYQMLRQQMLAWRVQRAPANAVERVSVLHISPAGNIALHAVTSPVLQCFGDDVFKVFRGLLIEPETFVCCATEQMFAPFLAVDYPDPAAREWAAYLRDRYTFLFAS